MNADIKKIINEKNIVYKVHNHKDLPKVIKSPQDFANALGYNLDRITKSVFVKCVKEERYAIVVCPMTHNINFKEIASNMECKKVEVAKLNELNEYVKYPKNGVSPIGFFDFPIFIDEQLLEFDSILIGAGQVGVEIEVSPIDLITITKAKSLILSKSK